MSNQSLICFKCPPPLILQLICLNQGPKGTPDGHVSETLNSGIPVPYPASVGLQGFSGATPRFLDITTAPRGPGCSVPRSRWSRTGGPVSPLCRVTRHRTSGWWLPRESEADGAGSGSPMSPGQGSAGRSLNGLGKRLMTVGWTPYLLGGQKTVAPTTGSLHTSWCS